MAFELPQLPYAFDALEPHIDAQTMQIHHDKHHAAYVSNLNAALEKAPEWQKRSLDDIVRKAAEKKARDDAKRGGPTLDAAPEVVEEPAVEADEPDAYKGSHTAESVFGSRE